MTTRRRSHWVSNLLIACSVVGLASFGIGSAAPVDQTENLGNQVSTLQVQPPADVEADLTLQLLSLRCRADISWTPSPTAAVDAYEIRRVVPVTNTVIAGPWTVDASDQDHVDYTPLPLLVNTTLWQVRAKVGNFPSVWVDATVDDPILCII